MRITIESEAETRDIVLKGDADIIDQRVRADIGRLNQVITNILGNAIKYTKEGGTVTYSIKQNGADENDRGICEFKIADTGIGMSKEFVEHIFDQFSKERTSTISGIQGTGLGMSIVKKTVTIMNSEIKVYSVLNKGTTVTLVLSLKIDYGAIEEKKESLESFDFGGKHVLLVEDNEMNREIANEILMDYGLIVDNAENGRVAIDKVVNAGHYDFVLMDVQMPVMDGYEATAEIRKLSDQYPDHRSFS